jgi:hypothetical protein
MNKIDLTGRVFGRWTVLSETPKTRPGSSLWRCQCACGKIKEKVRYTSLIRGASTSCGCSRFVGGTHNQQNPTYRSWQGMKVRCLNLKHHSSERYGRRGIAICPEWLNNFDRFKADMGDRPEGMTLDRIDSNLGYSKANCRWANRTEQAENRRNTRWFEWGGQRLCLAGVARAANVDYSTLYQCIFYGKIDLLPAIGLLRQRGSTFFDRRNGPKTNRRRTRRTPHAPHPQAA